MSAPEKNNKKTCKSCGIQRCVSLRQRCLLSSPLRQLVQSASWLPPRNEPRIYQIYFRDSNWWVFQPAMLVYQSRYITYNNLYILYIYIYIYILCIWCMVRNQDRILVLFQPNELLPKWNRFHQVRELQFQPPGCALKVYRPFFGWCGPVFLWICIHPVWLGVQSSGNLHHAKIYHMLYHVIMFDKIISCFTWFESYILSYPMVFSYNLPHLLKSPSPRPEPRLSEEKFSREWGATELHFGESGPPKWPRTFRLRIYNKLPRILGILRLGWIGMKKQTLVV